MPTNVIVTNDGTVATLTLTSEDGLHVLSMATMQAIADAIVALQCDALPRALVITGEGRRAFSAGADLTELAALDEHSAKNFSAFGQGVTQMIARFPAPVVAHLNGPAYGGGIELALACDFRLATPQAHLHYQASKLGLLPGWGGTQRLAALVGPARASAMMVLAKPVSPDLALDWGLLDAIAEPAEWFDGIGELDPIAMAQTKRAIALSTPLDFAGEQAAFSACFANGHAPALIRAWLGRRPRAAQRQNPTASGNPGLEQEQPHG
jgi:enoyl-CoA hydratase